MNDTELDRYIKSLYGDYDEQYNTSNSSNSVPDGINDTSNEHKSLIYTVLSWLKLFLQSIKITHGKKLPPNVLTVWFGVPGAGKTTFAAWLVRHDVRHHIPVWSNVPITGAYKFEPKDDIGNYMISNGRVIIDEAGIEYNNRDYKSFSEKELYFFKYHRHYQLAVDVFSQGYDDMDKKIRTLAQRLYVVKKSILPWFVYRKRIAKRVGINETTKEIIDEYYFVPMSIKHIFCPPLWKYFNTISRENYPEKKWEKW